jgi:hypothetical protein
MSFRPLSKIVAATTIALIATAPPLGAQEARDDRSASEVASTVPSTPLRRSIANEAARLAEGRVHATSAMFASQPSQPSQSWIGQHPVLTGALVGAGAGAVWAEILCRGQCEGDPRPYIALFGGAGAGIGAAIGGVIAAIRR